MADYVPPLRDIRFVLEHLADLDGLSKLETFAHPDPDTVLGVLEENGRFVAERGRPAQPGRRPRRAPQHQPDNTVKTPDGFIEAYAAYVEAGWGAVPFEPEYGGGGFPWLVGIVMQEFISSANMAFSMCPLLTQGAIDMLRHHGSEEQQRGLPAQDGHRRVDRHHEPHRAARPAPTSGRCAPRPCPAGDGTWRITGTKIFITFGEHDMADNIIHLVLARTPDAPPGTKGISCFIVPKFLVNDDGSPGRAQRRHLRVDRAQDGHQGQPHLRDELRRGRAAPSATSSARRTGACATCSR